MKMEASSLWAETLKPLLPFFHMVTARAKFLLINDGQSALKSWSALQTPAMNYSVRSSQLEGRKLPRKTEKLSLTPHLSPVYTNQPEPDALLQKMGQTQGFISFLRSYLFVDAGSHSVTLTGLEPAV